MECIARVVVRVWQQCQTLGRHRPAKRAHAAKDRWKKRTFHAKTFTARAGLNIWRAWPRWRYGHDKCTNDEHTSIESDGAGGPTAIGAVWRNGDGTVALQEARGRTAAALRPGVGRGGEAAVAAGTRVLPITGHVVHDEEL